MTLQITIVIQNSSSRKRFYSNSVQAKIEKQSSKGN